MNEFIIKNLDSVNLAWAFIIKNKRHQYYVKTSGMMLRHIFTGREITVHNIPREAWAPLAELDEQINLDEQTVGILLAIAKVLKKERYGSGIWQDLEEKLTMRLGVQPPKG